MVEIHIMSDYLYKKRSVIYLSIIYLSSYLPTYTYIKDFAKPQLREGIIPNVEQRTIMI